MQSLILFGEVVPESKVMEAGKKAVEAGTDVGAKVAETGQETWDQVTTQVTRLVADYLPNVAAAIGVLVVGWLVALIVSALIGAGLRRLKLLDSVSKYFAGEGGLDTTDLSRRVGKGVFYLLMLFVLVAFFQTLGLTIVTEPLNAFLNQVFTYAPRLIAAGVLLVVAWMLATGLRFVVRKLLTASKVDRRLTREAGMDGDDDLPLTTTISEAVYWLVYLLFLPLLLDALAVPGLLAPVQDMVQQILGFLPHLFGAVVILGIGWFVARIVQRVVANLLSAAGTDRLSERVGLTRMLGDNTLSNVLGMGIYILILVPVIVASLNALQIDAVTQPASEMLNRILGALPGIFAAVLVVGVAYVVGRVVSSLAVTMLKGLGFDKLPARLGVAAQPAEGSRTPSEIAGTVIMVAVVLFAAMQALPMLGFDLLADMMAQFLTFASNVLVGLVIFGFGLYFAKLVADLVSDSKIANAALLSSLARVSILILAGAMGLQQMELAQEIVNLAFGITLGAVAVASAIAFGIGGRDAAKRVVDNFVESRGNPKPKRQS